MKLAREWALCACMACIAAGVLQYLEPGKQKTSVIKLAATLYILVTMFAPLQALRYPDTRLQLSEAVAAAQSEEAPDTAALVYAQAEAELSAEISAQCARRGLAVQGVTVTLQEQDGSLHVTSVHLHSTEDVQTVTDAVWDALGCAAPVEVVQEEP